MNTPLAIPGYYYDSEKKKYFKVENAHTAPSSGTWTGEKVKKKLRLDEKVAVAKRHSEISKNRIKRIDFGNLARNPLTVGLLAREIGATMNEDIQTVGFARGLKENGTMTMTGVREWQDRPNIFNFGSHQVVRMYIGAQDAKTGMCTIHGALDSGALNFAYIPRDAEGRVDQRLAANYRVPARTWMPPFFFDEPLNVISDVKYHEPSHRLIVTSRDAFSDGRSNLWACSPLINEENGTNSPLWLLPAETCENIPLDSADRSANRYEAFSVATAPAASPLVCTVATSRGVLQWEQGASSVSWMAPPAPVGFARGWQSALDGFRDVFAVDFDPSQHNVVRFGGRPGLLISADMRMPYSSWVRAKLPSSITHLRCSNEGNQVLVAGLRNRLGIYDLRSARTRRGPGDDGVRVDLGGGGSGEGGSSQYVGSFGYEHPLSNSLWGNFRGRPRGRGQNLSYGRSQSSHGPEMARANELHDPHDPHDEDVLQPAFAFEGYRNNAHTDIGFAYDESTKIVAAAHDDVPGTVGLYSAVTGAQLRVLDPLPRESGPQPVVQTLQFEKFPQDVTPTLFIGAGRKAAVVAYSFGPDESDEV
ncbi:hypothetical protein GGR50DRAFT_674250 [Xylaria sp. CBS 124048]|nr:hypothetical protein GGR50DRAFT_674250 [Xylaria sp. CBS 124048]